VKAPEVTRRRLYLETMENLYKNTNKVVIDTEGGNNMMYLPLDQLMKNQSSSKKLDVDKLDPDGVSALTDQVINEIRKRQGASVTRQGRN